MSDNKEMRKRLNKIFGDIKPTEQEAATPREVALPKKPTKKITAAEPVPASRQVNTRALTGMLPSSAVTVTQTSRDNLSTLAIPFEQEDGLTSLEVVDDSHRVWQEDDRLLLRQVVDQLSLALQNAQLFQKTGKSAQQLQAIAEISTRISTILELQPLLEEAVHLTQRRFNLYHAHIFLLESNQHTLKVQACGWQEDDEHQGTHGAREVEIDQPVSIVARAARSRQVVVDNDVSQDPNWLANPLLPNIRAEMALPVFTGNNLLGVLNIHSDKINFFSEEDQAILSTLAAQIAGSIQNAQLYQQEQYRRQVADTLSDMARITGESLQLDIVVQRLLQQLPRLLSFGTASIQLVESQGKRRQVGGISYDQERLEEIHHPDSYYLRPEQEDPIIHEIVTTREPLILADVRQDPRWDVREETAHISSWMGVPLLVGSAVIGILILDHGTANTYTAEMKPLAKSIGAQAAVAIQNASLYAQAQQRAEEQSLLNEIVSSVSGSLKLENSLQSIAEKIQAYFKVGHIGITLISPDKKHLILVADTPAPAGGSPDLGTNIPIEGNAATIQVLNTRQHLWVEDVPNSPLMEPIREIMAKRGTQNLAIFPILAGEEVIGTAGVDILEADRRLSPGEISLLEAIFLQTATSIQNARLYQEIQNSETRFRDVALATADWVWEIDSRGRYTYCSDKVVEVLGYTPEEVIGKNPRAFMPADESERIGTVMRDLYRSKGRMLDMENRNLAKDGREVILLTNAVPMFDVNKKFTGYRGVNKDITVQRTDQKVDEVVAKITEIGVTEVILAKALEEIHHALQTIVPARNLYFALFDRERNQISYPYKADEHDPEPWSTHTPSTNLTTRVINTGNPLYASAQDVQAMNEAGEIIIRGTPSNIWIGLPLRTKETIGMFATQSYDDSLVLTREHMQILSRLAPQIATVVEKIRAEESILLQSAALEVAANTIVLTDLGANITWANPAFEKQTGFSREEVIGRKTSLLKSGKHGADFYTNLWETILSGKTWFGEITNRRKDGTLFIIEQTITPVKNASGEVTNYVSIWQDVTERNRTEEALRRQNEYLATATEVGRIITSTLDLPTLFNRTTNLIRSRFGYYHVAIFIVEETGFNAVLREATGEAGEEMKARQHALAVGSKSIIGNVTANGRTLIVNNTALDPIYRINPQLPETRAEAGIPLKIGQRVIGALDIQSREVGAFLDEDIAVLETLADQVAVAIDNARSYELAQKAVTEMRELDRIKSQFLANMSHELRTPLNSIIGFSRVIIKGIDGAINEQQNQDLLAIYNSGQHLLMLINDILDLSKIEAGKMELALEEVNLADSISSVLTTAMGLIKDKPIQMVKEIESGLPTVRADAMRIRQVLLNLVSNASKFTEEGAITIAAQAHVSSDGVHEVMVSVTDTGPGISPEDQKKLFLAFSQVDSSATRKSGGTGLGLSICARLVDLHGGRIGVHSAEGEGSTFYFTLPMYHQPKNNPVGDGKIILCIDDDPQITSLYERYLKPEGYQVVPVSNAATAKDAAKRLHPYAITLDIMMPDVDGWQILQELKNDPETRNLPVIICSIVEEEEKGFSLGAADYLVKPILEDDLIGALNRLNGDGSIQSVLVIDDSAEDLRLIEKILSESGSYQPVLAQGGLVGWKMIETNHPQAIILDLFMPEMDGFAILERLRTDAKLRDIPVLVISGAELTSEQREKLDNLGKQMLQKGMLTEKELFSTLEKTLKRLNAG
ncbi:MAG: hypothetical protein CO094_12200 [Anaerolineae bacterium CG_4_9_14_3_um_filter_57_17]|nr:GAF domain-containing protein [bacterium]OIO84805.1 MAG: hypothetical protein AUK01_08300 [Anaerolineae bacterium CG2_30_57_67]PJB64737.1 MAG: hypothetical protein CO094_12200 [Anaerolineae bacterium CG_4_9_14_3_um_filter_57_17]